MKKQPKSSVLVTIAAAAGVSLLGLLVRSLVPELVRYARIRRM